MIGELLAEVRKDHGDTQQDLADRLCVSISTVRSWENEKSSPSHETLVSICRLYQVSADYLLGLTRIDPIYANQKRLELFEESELEALSDFEEFLIWRKKFRSTKKRN